MKNYFSAVMGEGSVPEYISAVSSSQVARIRINDIEVIEQEGRKIHVITAENEYCFYGSITDMVQILAGRAFYRPVRGLIINFDHVKDITGNSINFMSGQCVTMGKNSITKARSAYKGYLRRYPPYSLWEPQGPRATYSSSNTSPVWAAADADTKNEPKIC